MITHQRQNLILFLIPAIIVAALYFPVIHFNLLWDDPEWVEKINLVKGNFCQWLVYAFSNATIGNYYRPVVLSTFYYPFNSATPVFFWHLTNLCLYIFNIILLGMIFLRLYNNALSKNPKKTNLFTGIGLLFFVALHPSQVETVTWISCRFDLMSNTFLLLMVLVEISTIRRTLQYFLQPFLFLMALLCKETAVVFLAAYPILAHYHSPSNSSSFVSTLRKNSLMLLFFAVIVFFYFGLWNAIVGIHNFMDTEKLYPLYTDTISHIYLVLGTIGYYAKLLFYPFTQLNPYHGIDTPITLHNPYLWLGFSVILLFILAAIIKIQIFPVLLVIFITISPFLNEFQISYIGSVIQNRYLSLPLLTGSIAFYIFLLRTTIPERLSKTGFFFVFYLVFMAITAYSTLPLWKNNLSLWTWIHHENPQSAYAKNNLASALMLNKNNAAALQLLEESLAINQNFWVYSNISEILWQNGEYLKSSQYALKALEGEMTDLSIIFIFNMARKNIALGEFANARTFLNGAPEAAYQSARFKNEYDELIREIENGINKGAENNVPAMP